MKEITSDILASANTRSQRLRHLILSPATLVMPGGHDVLTARLFGAMGLQAIQCASGGIAAGLLYIDGEVVTIEQTFHGSQIITEAVAVPVNWDGERGYGNGLDVVETVRG